MSEASKKISEYIRKGWKISSYHCPLCSNPLVSRDNTHYCAVCEKEVKVVRDEEEYRSAVISNVLENLKIEIVNSISQIMAVEDWSYDEKYLELIDKYLEILSKINRIYSSE
jgi:uncharacterized Zn finger protein (UPF0148 family)